MQRCEKRQAGESLSGHPCFLNLWHSADSMADSFSQQCTRCLTCRPHQHVCSSKVCVFRCVQVVHPAHRPALDPGASCLSRARAARCSPQGPQFAVCLLTQCIIRSGTAGAVSLPVALSFCLAGASSRGANSAEVCYCFPACSERCTPSPHSHAGIWLRHAMLRGSAWKMRP